MIQLGLIGYPLEHSLSPKIHNAALKACDLQGDYSLFPIRPDDKQGLKDLLTRVRMGEITGLNVTIPHKQNVIEFLDELQPTAKAVGAVNTIYLEDEKIIGDNTDALGFLRDLHHFIAISDSEIESSESAIVLGAGGSARAIVFALLRDDWNVTIASRRIEQAQELASSFPDYKSRIKFHELQNLQMFQLSSPHLIVNTTPLGMFPNTNDSPLPEDISLSSKTVIYDLVYNPRETKLVRAARSKGLSATTGLGMLIAQATLAFEIWTGHKPPKDILYASVVE
jgi:shikimate dehydrogenase